MRALKAAIAGAVVVCGCGPANQADGLIDPSGGQVCSTDNRICIEIPNFGLERPVTIVIKSTKDVPSAAVGPGYEIGPSGTTFLKPATVTYKYGDLADDAGINPLLLRLYTRYEGDWVPLGTPKPPIDRVVQTVSGTVDHLSPFVLLRADLLPDGGQPQELDGGNTDSGMVIVPYVDAGRPDAGKPDAGRPDAGTPDAGTPDAGTPDAGTPDAGRPDAGTPDAGTPDAGTPDAGVPDAGVPDAGVPDAGKPDAGMPVVDAGFDAGFDAGIDAGSSDAGDGG